LITALAGGVGAARFLTGLTRLVKEEDMTVIANTGDDIELFGLHISPDIDIVAYTLAGIVDEERGWGIRGDTFQCLETLKKRGLDTWFGLGDRDLATHIYRTDRLKQGFTLTQITSEVCQSLGLKIKILPMTNDKFETRITTGIGSMHFEEYFVRRKCKDEILSVEFVGAVMAKPSPGVLDAILDASYLPIRFISLVGIITSALGVLYSATIVISWLRGETPFTGWAPIMIAILLVGGLIMVMLGVIGEYVWRINEEVRKRPNYVVRDKFL